MKYQTILRAFAALAALILAIAARAESPVIESIEMGRTNVTVTAVVPSGHARILLECRNPLRSGAWIPVAVKRVAGEGGAITFNLPRTSDFALFRVRADVTEPLPASFYTGTNFFDAQPDYGGFMGWPILTANPSGFQLFSTAGPTPVTPMAQVLGVGEEEANNSLAVTPVESRAVVESDIWRVDGDTLYFFNQNRGLQIIDISNPDAATLLGTLNLPGAGEQMYLLRTNHVVLLARPVCGENNSQVLVVAVSNGAPAIVASVPVEGRITESRLVGTALYVAAQTARPLAGSGATVWESGARIQSFDLAVPDAPISRSTLWYPGAGDVVHATDTYLFAVTTDPTNSQRSIVNAIDITAHDGTMNACAAIPAAGRVADKFKMAWNDNVISVISEVSSAPRVTKLETFRLPDPRSVSVVAPFKLGEVELGRGERLFATRFDGTRAYVVTFLQIDPLWVVDISDPAHPAVSGELQVPGWSTYIHPMGNRLVAVGRENSFTTVSLFDVSDPSHPALLARVPLGQSTTSEANSDEKAFTVLEEAGLILLPVQGYTTDGYRSWVQLLDLGTNSLRARGFIGHDAVPRRATLHRDRIVSLSAAELLSVDASDRDQPQLSGRLALARSINRVFVVGDYLIEITSADSGPGSGAPAVSVAMPLDADRVLETLMLTNVPIVGATVHSNRLYVLQASRTLWISPAGTNLPPPRTLWLTAVDLSGLPALNVLGQTATASSVGWNSRFEPVWPKPNLLVWAGSGNNYVRGWHPWGMVSPGMPAFITSLWSNEGRPLLAFDVSNDNAPALLSEVNLADGGWNFSKPFATDGLVYLSHQSSVVEANAANSTNTATFYFYGWPRFHRSFLDVVDYSDARHPAVRPPVNIPGTLQGISHGGALLYTVGSHRTLTNWYVVENTVDASAYDGVSAYRVDSLSLSNSASHPVLVSGTDVFLGRAPAPALSSATNVLPTLETWTVSSAGQFTRLGSVSLPGVASDLVSFPGLLAASIGGTRLLVFDNANPAALRQVGQGTTAGCLSFDLRHADAVRKRALWIPLNDYGATKVELAP